MVCKGRGTIFTFVVPCGRRLYYSDMTCDITSCIYDVTSCICDVTSCM